MTKLRRPVRSKSSEPPGSYQLSAVCSDVTPGKKGGTFPIPEGGKITIAEGQFGRKECISVHVVPANQYASHCPRLDEQECIVSHVYELKLPNQKEVDVPLKLRLPLIGSIDDGTLNEVKVQARYFNGDSSQYDSSHGLWNFVEKLSESDKLITFETTKPGTFVLIRSAKSEEFEVNPNGGLLNLKLNPIMSVRIPKRAYHNTNGCLLSILPFDPDRIECARSMSPSETLDIINISDMYVFDFPPVEFKRVITVRLPLPKWVECEEGLPHINPEQIVLMHKFTGKWDILETGSAMKFTKNSVTFDSKILTKFLLVQITKPDKAHRAKMGIQLLEDFNNSQLGEILVFSAIEKNKWTLCAECVPQSQIVNTISDRVQKKGWVFLQRLQEEEQQESPQESPTRRRGRYQKHVSRKSSPLSAPGVIRFKNGSTYSIKLTGEDFILKDNYDNHFQYHSNLQNNTALFEITPSEKTERVSNDFFLYLWEKEKEKELNLSCPSESSVGETHSATEENMTFKTTIEIIDQSNEQVHQRHQLNLEFNDVKNYLNLKPPPPTPETVDESVITEELVEDIPVKQTINIGQRVRRPLASKVITPEEAAKARAESFQRLTRPKKNALLMQAAVSREPKVLSRRSLQVLSQEIKQGLTLAVHLNLPESSITGIGFDALSGGSTMSDVTYKVLTLWKRVSSGKRGDTMVEQLLIALEGMNRGDLTPTVAACHRVNTELTPECFHHK